MILVKLMKLNNFVLALQAHVCILQNLHQQIVNPMAKQCTSSVVCVKFDRIICTNNFHLRNSCNKNGFAFHSYNCIFLYVQLHVVSRYHIAGDFQDNKFLKFLLFKNFKNIFKSLSSPHFKIL